MSMEAPAANGRPPKPAQLPIAADSIPAELRDCHQWHGWRYQWELPTDTRAGKWDKPPISAKTGRTCNDGDVNKLATFDYALSSIPRLRFDGVGFRFLDSDPFCGLDLDDCRDPETGELTAEAQVVVGMMNTYTEISPSGCGLKMFARGKLPWGSKADHEIGVEAYDKGRYFCVTGRHLHGTPNTLRDIAESELRQILSFAFGIDETGKAYKSPPPPAPDVERDDKQLAIEALGALKPHRVDGYFDWLRVGMSLRSTSEDLLFDWDSWSRSSAKYVEGECERKWRSFKSAGSRTAKLGSLIHMAIEDGWTPPWLRNGHAKRRSPRRVAPVVLNGEDNLSLLCPDGRTEVANARRFARLHCDTYRWCESWKKGFVWDGRRWALDLERRADALAKEIYERLWSEFTNGAKESSDVVKEMLRFVRQTGSASGIDSMVRLAKSEPGIPIGPAELDVDPWLLNVQNGTLDLRAGELRDHSRGDRITKLCPVAYDAAADCPLWVQFIRDITAGDEALQDYLRKAAGCSLTGDVSEHVLFFCYGTGANGKSTFLNTLADMLGPDYAMKAAPDLLLVKGSDSHPTERADLAGKRFVSCIEAGEGRRMAETLVKEITGGDMIRARRMREDFWQFRPSHKVWLAANHKPNIRGTDEGIWRRIKLIPFSVCFAAGKQDKTLPAKLATEFSGILNWALWGCREWRLKGLAEPQAVIDATGDYRRQQDVLAEFLAECCDVAEGLRVAGGVLLKAYRNWSGDERMSQRRLGDMLAERGFDKDRSGGTVYRTGLAVKIDV